MPETPPLPHRITLHAGETTEVELPGLGAAGYRWTAEVISGEVGVESIAPAASEVTAGNLLGASEPARFLISAGRGGEARVRFVLARPWEEAPAELREIVVAIEP